MRGKGRPAARRRRHDRPAPAPAAGPGSVVLEAARHLGAVDPRLARVIERMGPRPLPKMGVGFSHLVRAIIFQQISGAAGAAILRKVRSAHGGPGFPTPRWFLSASDDRLRAAGLSPQKRRYIVDLARHVTEGHLRFSALRHAADAEVVEVLTQVRGIGVWTAQMYLIFSLNRPDVLPSGDLGIRKAVQVGWGYRALPSPRTVERIGAKWAPYRSYAAYYLWASLEEDDTRAGEAKGPTAS